MVTFILHNVSWQQCISVSTVWEFLQRTATSSLPTMHPFCGRAVPFLKDREEKHCRPKQRWTSLQDNPSHTHSTSLVLPLSAENTHKKDISFHLQLWDAQLRHMDMPLSSTTALLCQHAHCISMVAAQLTQGSLEVCNL